MRIQLFLALVIAAGCGSVTALPDAPPELPPAYLGAWQASSGDLWASSYGTPRFMQFDEDGGGSLYTRFEPAGVLGCGLGFLHAGLFEGVIALDIQGQRIYHYELADENTLVLSDQAGRTLTLTRTTEVPANAKCGELQVAQAVTDIHVQMHGFSGLGIASPTAFWISGQDYLPYTINPSTGVATAAPYGGGQYVHVQTFEGANYWAHCGCGGSQDIQLRTPDANPAAVTTIDTVTLGAGISVRAAAWDGMHLWLGGGARDGSGKTRILKIATSAGERTLADSFEFTGIQSLGTVDGKLYAIANGLGPTLVRIDTTTKLAAASYALPAGYQWRALAGAAGSLWLAGNEPDGDLRLLRVTAP
ncbi:MAG TPA: hypothetical protein VM513_25910 [Kofleriaceae bacterium]|jgi:hypothetical protein|nr:hypothetical protein [Kofleriaceae bacterium]